MSLDERGHLVHLASGPDLPGRGELWVVKFRDK
jgi:hypothetical protein